MNTPLRFYVTACNPPFPLMEWARFPTIEIAEQYANQLKKENPTWIVTVGEDKGDRD